MKKICLLFALLVFAGFSFLQAQTVQVTGTVTSAEDGMPIPGSSVQVVGTTIGVATDMDGKYAINVPAGSTALEFRSVGYSTLVLQIEGRSVVNAVLESEMLSLEEIVVTALGIRREKKVLGYSVQEAKGEEITRAANPNFETVLSGKFSGVQVRQSSGMPGAPSQIYVRGARSFSGNNAPLYVVDGMPIVSDNDYASNVTGSAYSNRALDLDPNDIESINVLKGQAAAALYGMRASNGVVIIITKKGRTGTLGKPVVSFSSNMTMDNVSRLPEVQQTYAQGTGGVFRPANSFSWGPKLSDLPNDPTYGGNNYAGHNNEFFDPYTGEWVKWVDGDKVTAFNNPAAFYNRNGYTYNNSLNISNATEMGNYSFGFSSSNQTGIIKATDMERYNAKMAGDFNLTEKWNLGFSGNYSDSKVNKLPSGNDSWLFTVYGAPPSFDLAGTPFHQEGADGDYRQISYRRGAVGINPYWAMENNIYNEATKRFYGNGYLEFKPVTWAAVKYQIGVDTYTTNNSEYKEMGSGDLPTAAQYPTPNNPVYAYVAPTGGTIDKYGITRRVINSLLTATFSHKFNDDLSATLLLGNELDHNTSEFYKAYGSGFTTPGWNNLNNTNTQFSYYYEYARRTVGFFGNLNVDYLNMLFLNVTGRQDIVSSMPRNNRTFFYPSASLSFVFTEIDALKNNPSLSFGKLRLSYAEVGQAADAFYANPYFGAGGANSGFLTYGVSYPWQGVTGYKLSSTLYDMNLTPQNTQTYEVGFDIRFFKNRVGVDYSFYNQVATDQIFAVPMAGSTGYSQIVMNAGKMKGVGHEVILTLKPVVTRDFDWTITSNFSKMVNTVVELAPGVENISLGGYVTPNIRASAGDTYPAIYGEQFVRDAEGRILVNEDPNDDAYGMPMVGEFGKIGDVSPNFILTVNNTFSLFNSINIFAQIDWKDGGQMYSGSNRLMDLYGTSKRTENREDPFTYDGFLSNGQPNNIERGGSSDPDAYEILYSEVMDALSEAHIYGTSFVKLREVGISYSLPRRIIAPIKVSSATLGFVARNILLWSELPYFDPEASQGQGNMAGGMDYMSLPQTTSYGFSLNLTF